MTMPDPVVDESSAPASPIPQQCDDCKGWCSRFPGCRQSQPADDNPFPRIRLFRSPRRSTR